MVYFVGAGPGDPELITVKGKKLIESADVIIYAGSLVNRALLSCAKEGAVIHNSAGMTLEEVIAVAEQNRDKLVVRLHTGDPSIFGAVREQMDRLRAAGIPFASIPGVSSFTAAAAAVDAEFTLPGVSQTVILTRCAGRTAVPEDLRALAAHNASMALFLSVGMIEDVVRALVEGGYALTTRAAVVEKASWPEQRIVRGTLSDIAQKVRDVGILKTAQILVGDFLGDEYELSRLYDKGFGHGFRAARP